MEKKLKEKLTKQFFLPWNSRNFEQSISKKKKTAEELTKPKTTGKKKVQETIPDRLKKLWWNNSKRKWTFNYTDRLDYDKRQFC